MKLYVLLVLLFSALFIETSVAQLTLKITGLPENTPNGTKIYAAGDFNGWNPADENNVFKLSSDGTYNLAINTDKDKINYKITLGSWDKVECNTDKSEIANRVSEVKDNDTISLIIKAWKLEEKKSTKAGNVHIVKDDFYIPQLERKRRIWVYLPPNYLKTDKKYPVLYMHDAQNLFDDLTSYSGEWGVDESLNALYDKTGKGLIVVGIEHGDSLRIDELTPWSHHKYGGGKGADYAKFIVETLKPFIDKKYRTSLNPDRTGLMGSSLGGLITFYMGLKYQKVFSKLGVFSPSFWYSKKCFKQAENFDKQTTLRMYILAGGKEGGNLVEKVNKMEKILVKKGFLEKELKTKIVAEGTHNESFWKKEFYEAIEWLFWSH